jgi:hypothetical protein
MAGINSFIQKIGEGVKPNMFLVQIPFPGGNEDDLTNLLCKSTALPASNLGVIEVPFRGRTVKIVGDRTFDTWSATFFNDKNMSVRSKFESWLASMNSHEPNTAPLFEPRESDGYMQKMIVQQLRKDGTSGDDATGKGNTVLREYTLRHAFPTSISQIDLAYDSNDQIEEFTVEFQYSYWTVTGGNSDTSDSNL